MDYSPKCHIFWCNSIRVVRKIQKEMSVERSIFADVLSYQLITSTLLTDEAESLKLNGSREKKIIHRSIWNNCKPRSEIQTIVRTYLISKILA